MRISLQRRWTLGLGALAAVALACAAGAQTPAPAADAVAELQARLDRGEARLDYRDKAGGYLPSLLANLHVPVDSQVLVFTKTSLQVSHIGPKTPRAVYFNDNVAVGAVQDGGLYEIIAQDPKAGLAFYTLSTGKTGAPRFERHGDDCLSCHGRINRWAPALVVANVIPQDDGSPLITSTERLFDVTDHRTPYAHRWGGWYVTGTHGAMRHNGNVLATPDNPGELDPHAGLNLTDLSTKIDISRYLAPSSDITALMTLEHQVGATNLIGRINGQMASVADGNLAPEQRATPAQVDASIEELVAYLLLVGEPPLPSPVKGISTFAATFAGQGPRDPKGRGLHQLDLQTRLLRYPLSYMIYSQAFESLNPQAKARVYRRLFAVLSGADASPRFARLAPADRRAALEIAAATKPGLPDYWRTAALGR
jgi:hypothetical protein